MNTVPPLSLRERRRRISVKGKLLLVLMPTTVLAELALVEALSNQRLLFVSLANESDALTIGDLVVENRVDRISTHGNVELTRDRKGLAMAKGDQGHERRDRQSLEAEKELPDKVETVKPRSAKNPVAWR